MKGTVLPPSRLVCPNGCPTVAPNIGRAPIGGGTSTFHECRFLAGMLAPLVPEGTRAENRTVERDDYVSGETVRYDTNRRPIMATETVRDTGTDRMVFAPCATAKVGDDDDR